MQLTKDVLEADLKVFEVQLASVQAAINYIKGLIAFVEKEVLPEPDKAVEPAVTEGEVVDG